MADSEVNNDYPEVDYSSAALRGCYTHPKQMFQEADLRDEVGTPPERRYAAALREEARRWEAEIACPS